jgi:hypothetical protein
MFVVFVVALNKTFISRTEVIKIITIKAISILQNKLKLFNSICEVGSLSIVIKWLINFKILLSELSIVLVEESSIFNAKVKNTHINNRNKNTPVKIGFLGLLIIYRKAVATSIAVTIIINTGLIVIAITPPY